MVQATECMVEKLQPEAFPGSPESMWFDTSFSCCWATLKFVWLLFSYMNSSLLLCHVCSWYTGIPVYPPFHPTIYPTSKTWDVHGCIINIAFVHGKTHLSCVRLGSIPPVMCNFVVKINWNPIVPMVTHPPISWQRMVIMNYEHVHHLSAMFMMSMSFFILFFPATCFHQERSTALPGTTDHAARTAAGSATGANCGSPSWGHGAAAAVMREEKLTNQQP